MKKSVWLRIISLDLLMLCFACSVSIVGQMLTPLSEIYSLSLTQSGWLISSQSIGGIVFVLLCIFYIDRISKDKFMLFAGILLALMFFLTGFALPVFVLFIIFALIGFSGSTLNGLSNSVMSDTVPNRADRHINLLHMSFSFGAVLTPVLSQYIFDNYGLGGVFLVFGAIVLLIVIYSFFAFRKQLGIRMVKQSVSLKERLVSGLRVMKIPGMPTIVFLSIALSCAQLCLVYYTSAYFLQISGSSAYGAAALSAYFLFMLSSRLVYSRIAGRFSKGRVLAVTNIISFVFLMLLIIVPGTAAKIVFLCLASIFHANNFPIVYASSFDAAPQHKAAATGYVTLGYYIALLLFLPAAGALGEAFGIEFSVASAMLPLIAVAVLGIVLHKKTVVRKS